MVNCFPAEAALEESTRETRVRFLSDLKGLEHPVLYSVLVPPSAFADASSVLAEVPVGRSWPALLLCAEPVGSSRKPACPASESGCVVL